MQTASKSNKTNGRTHTPPWSHILSKAHHLHSRSWWRHNADCLPVLSLPEIKFKKKKRKKKYITAQTLNQFHWKINTWKYSSKIKATRISYFEQKVWISASFKNLYPDCYSPPQSQHYIQAVALQEKSHIERTKNEHLIMPRNLIEIIWTYRINHYFISHWIR